MMHLLLRVNHKSVTHNTEEPFWLANSVVRVCGESMRQTDSCGNASVPGTLMETFCSACVPAQHYFLHYRYSLLLADLYSPERPYTLTVHRHAP